MKRKASNARGWQLDAAAEYLPLLERWKAAVRECRTFRDAGELKKAQAAFPRAEQLADQILKLDAKHRRLGRRIKP